MKSSKGASFERDTAKRLSRWWTGGLRDDVFWRPLHAGGWAGMRAKKKKGGGNQFGDLQAIDPVGKPLVDFFTIELKRGYKKWELIDFLDAAKEPKNLPVVLFWKQAEDQAREENKVPLLITRRDFKSPLAFLPESIWSILSSGTSRITPAVGFTLRGIGKQPIRVIPLQVFLDTVSPASIVKLSQP